MRGLKSTIALLVVLVGLGAYIYFVASKPEDTSSKNEKLFPGVVSDNIEELTVKSATGDVTTLKKQDGKWAITSPLTTRGSDLDASGIASGIANLEQTRVVEENAADVSAFGLDKPEVEVSFTSKDNGPSGKFLVGSKTPTGDSLYVRKDGDKRVVLVGGYNEATFNKSTFDLRDKQIMAFDRSKVDSFDVVLDGKPAFEVAKKDGDWRMVKPIEARADASASDGLVSSLESAQMKAVVSTAPTPDELKRYGLDKPQAVVNLRMGSARASFAVGSAAGDDTVYAKDVSRPDVYTIQKAVADDYRKTADDYRRKDMFDMRAFTASHIEITRNGKTLVLDKVKGTGDNATETWKRTTPAGDVDKDKLGAFVAALADIRAVSFTDAKTKTGLDNPAMTVVVKFDDGKKEDKVTLAKNGDDAYASRPDDPGAAKIDASKLDDAIKSVDEFAK